MIKLDRKALMRVSLTAAALSMLCGSQAALAAQRMTEEKMIEYYHRFNEGDPRYADLLADDVVFPHITGKTFHGKKEVMAFYQSMKHDGFKETREPSTIVIDNEHGIMACELTIHIKVETGAGPTLPSGEVVQPGDELEGHSVIFYEFKNGKITSIRGALAGPSKLVKVR